MVVDIRKHLNKNAISNNLQCKLHINYKITMSY